MLPRQPVLCSIAAAASLALLPFAASAASAAMPRAVPLRIDFALTPAQIDASCKSEIAAAGKRVDAMLHARSKRTFRTVAEPLENVIADLGDNLAAQTFLFNVAPDKAVRDASERCNTAQTGYLAELFARPDLFAAYVGTGQVINLRKQLEAGYPTLRARAAAHAEAEGELKAIGSPPWNDDDAYRTVNEWASALDPPSQVDPHVCESERREIPPTYIQAGAQFSSRLLSEAIGRENLETWATHYDVPVFFIQGREDVLTTTSVVAEYVQKIEAPSKALIELPASGHFAIFRNPDAFLAALRGRVRPFAMVSP